MEQGVLGPILGFYMIIILAIVAISIIASWRIFEKAGIEGWKSLIPVYNVYLMYEIAFGNGWLFLLLFIPIVNVVIGIVFSIKLAEVFGQGVGFGIGLMFLPFIFYLILGFGDAEYIGGYY